MHRFKPSQMSGTSPCTPTSFWQPAALLAFILPKYGPPCDHHPISQEGTPFRACHHPIPMPRQHCTALLPCSCPTAPCQPSKKAGCPARLLILNQSATKAPTANPALYAPNVPTAQKTKTSIIHPAMLSPHAAHKGE